MAPAGEEASTVPEKDLDRCEICGNAGSQVLDAIELVDRRKGLAGSWYVSECVHCHVRALVPKPSEAELATYYSAYSNNEDISFSPTMGTRRPWLRTMFHRLSGDVDPRDFVRIMPGERVLDYGCGRAGYLGDFHHRGVDISGAEIAEYVVKACQQRGFDVRRVEKLSNIPFGDDEFDVVYLMQVFEHLREPHVFMQELSRVLKRGGALYLAVPNINSIWRKVFGKNWVSGWFAPFHLFYYSRDSLAKLAAMHGFDLEDSWSNTPEAWFRMNLKAWLYPEETRLDWCSSWLDMRLVRYCAMVLLRIIELPVRERDCLVVKLAKR